MLKPQTGPTREVMSLDGLWRFATSAHVEGSAWTARLPGTLEAPVPASYNDLFVDPAIRDQIVRFMIEDQGDRLTAKRRDVAALCSERPNAIGLSAKLRVSEHRRRLLQFALSLQGANAARFVGDVSAVDNGKWQRAYLNAFSSTIGAATQRSPGVNSSSSMAKPRARALGGR